MKKRVYIVLIVLTALIPLGLLTNAPAWGEWGKEYYKNSLGFIPKGIESTKELNSPIKDYTIASLGDISSYYLSAIIGIIMIFIIFYILTKVFNAKNS